MLLFACTEFFPGVPDICWTMNKPVHCTKFVYPVARRDETVVDDYHGQRVINKLVVADDICIICWYQRSRASFGFWRGN